MANSYPGWIEENCSATNGQSFELKSFAGTFPITTEMLRKSAMEFEWLHYEVDPKWSKFCSFGPEDIGSVWEKIGAIRKRRIPSYLIIAEGIAAKMNAHFEKEMMEVCSFDYGSAQHNMDLFGIRVHASSWPTGSYMMFPPTPLKVARYD